MDAALVIDQSLVSDALSSLALNTFRLYQSGTPVKWNDAEVAVYVVYIFGEINKSPFLLGPLQTLLTDPFVSWLQRSGGILSNPSYNRQGKTKRDRLLGVPSHTTRRNALRVGSVWNFCISESNGRNAVFRGRKPLW